jgi:hypothetical protein
MLDFVLEHFYKDAVRDAVRGEESDILTIQSRFAEGGDLKGRSQSLETSQRRTHRLLTLMAQNSVRLVLNLIMESLN